MGRQAHGPPVRLASSHSSASDTSPMPAPASHHRAARFESVASWPLRLVRAALLAAALALPAVGTTAAGLFLAKQWIPLPLRLNILAGVSAYHYMAALVILGIVAAGFAWLRPAERASDVPPPGLVVLSVLAVTAALASVILSGAIVRAGAPGVAPDLMLLPYTLQVQLMVAGLLVAAREWSERGAASARALHETGLRRSALDAELSAARLRVLQAQVEPHFLFNSLANLRRLVRTDPAGAKTMIDALLRYLEEALPRLREQRTTLAREAELVRAYLAVHQVRMGEERLRVTMDVPPELGSVELPPMMLLTLVENAIKHGLQPLVEGGSVHVEAKRLRDGQDECLVLTVADTGRGMGSASGTGTGLANLRAQLKAIHGGAASLTLRVNEPRGVVATIALPMSMPAPGSNAAKAEDRAAAHRQAAGASA